MVPGGANVTGAGATSVYTLCLVTVFDVLLMACGWNRRGFEGELGRLLSEYCSISANLGFLFGVDGGDASDIVLDKGVDRSNWLGLGEQMLMIRSKKSMNLLFSPNVFIIGKNILLQGNFVKEDHVV